MDRRKFLSFSAITALVVPAGLSAIDFRATKPATWTAKKVEDSIKALYGDITIIHSDVKVKVPKVASSGGSVPVTVKSSIEAKSVAIFQDMNPESTVAVFTVNENGIVDYSMKIKLKATDTNGGNGTVTAVVEGKDGKFYSATYSLEVTKGGCEG
jgi:sulfur-oxidizing protein SoxY